MSEVPENYYGKSRIYYSNGDYYNVKDINEAVNHRKTGVIAIVQIVDSARRTLTGCDYYWPMGQEWCQGDWHGLMCYLAEPGAKLVLFGINIPTHEYKNLMLQISQDTEFPKVSHA